MTDERIETTDQDGEKYEANATQVGANDPQLLPVKRYVLVKDIKGECEHCNARVEETPHGPLVEYSLLEAVVNENDFLREQHSNVVGKMRDLDAYIHEHFGRDNFPGSLFDAALQIMERQRCSVGFDMRFGPHATGRFEKLMEGE